MTQQTMRERLLSSEPIPDVVTFGDLFKPCFEANTPAEAEAYMAKLAERTMRITKTTDLAEALKIERQNLGYFAGYYGPEIQAKVQRLFNVVHPITGGK